MPHWALALVLLRNQIKYLNHYQILPSLDICIQGYRQTSTFTGREEIKDKVLIIREGVAKLPPAHYQTLKYLVSHLVR